MINTILKETKATKIFTCRLCKENKSTFLNVILKGELIHLTFCELFLCLASGKEAFFSNTCDDNTLNVLF